MAAQDIIIKGIIVIEKIKKSFGGFPLVKVEEADADIPVVLSVSKYSKDEYRNALRAQGIINMIEIEY